MDKYAWLPPLSGAVSRVSYKDWEFHVDIDSNGAPYRSLARPKIGEEEREI